MSVVKFVYREHLLEYLKWGESCWEMGVGRRESGDWRWEIGDGRWKFNFETKEQSKVIE